MHCWSFLSVICTCLIISIAANDDLNDPQGCSGGFCVLKVLCPNGVYNETYAQSVGIISPRVGKENVCGDDQLCCNTNVQTNKDVLKGFCVLKDLCPNGVYNEIYAQDRGMVRLRTIEDNECRDEEVCCKNENSGKVNPATMSYQSLKECVVNNSNEVDEANAQKGEYPWVVLILQQNQSSHSNTNSTSQVPKMVGGGTLIHTKFVLTAAHILESKDNLIARFGEWDFGQNDNDFPIQNIAVQNIIMHPNYSRVGLRNDIALAQLKQDVQYDKHIQSIHLPSPTDRFDGQLCVSAGWGTEPTGEYSSVLKRVFLPIIPHEKCKQLFAATRLGPHFRLHGSVLCAGGVKNADMCEGDGGSGLFCNIEPDTYVLAGIVSWGLTCGESDVPGAYVNVAKFMPWIESVM